MTASTVIVMHTERTIGGITLATALAPTVTRTTTTTVTINGLIVLTGSTTDIFVST
jgi:hypothetical protein